MRGQLDEWQLREVKEMLWSLEEALIILDSGRDLIRARSYVRSALDRIGELLEDQQL